MPTKYLAMAAHISSCSLYRYSLNRVWDADLPPCTFIGLNPSTADAEQDDPTIRRCVGFAASWGCGELIMVNLFPYRATNPADLIGFECPADVAHANDVVVAKAIGASKYAIAAWGNTGNLLGASERMIERHRDRLHYLKLNRGSGQPAHPLYLLSNLKPIAFTVPAHA